MIRSLIIASFVSFSFGAFAAEPQVLGCFKAVNPQNVTISLYDAHHEAAIKQENGLSAKIMLKSAGESKTEGYFIPATVRLTVKSATLRTVSIASNFDPKQKNVYGIECDGGSVTIDRKGNQAVANAEYLASESTVIGEEGCGGPSTLKIDNVVFEKVACK